MISTILQDFSITHELLTLCCPKGYFIAYDVKGAAPAATQISYPKEWYQKYEDESYVMDDPTVRWGLANTGWERWSSLPQEFFVTPRAQLVMDDAASFGLKFGIVMVIESNQPDPKKTFFGAARSDREVSNAEVATILQTLESITKALDSFTNLTTDERIVLELRGQGQSVKEISQNLKISAATVKNRLHSGQKRLNAQNPTQTLLLAQSARLIETFDKQIIEVGSDRKIRSG